MQKQQLLLTLPSEVSAIVKRINSVWKNNNNKICDKLSPNTKEVKEMLMCSKYFLFCVS